MLANSSGSQTILLDQATRLWGPDWSPDGQWICYLRSAQGALKLAKIRATAGTQPVMVEDTDRWDLPRWSPAGDWIICARAAGGLDLISPDGKLKRMLTTRWFDVYDFSKDGSQVYGIFHNKQDKGAEWQLYAVNVKTGAEKVVTAVDFPPSFGGGLQGFSIHPDGKRALASIPKSPSQIWMLEGFEQQQKNWFARLMGRP